MTANLLNALVPGAGLEPARACAQRILRADPTPAASDGKGDKPAPAASELNQRDAACDRD